jgi:protein-export membrane protein SecD
MRKHPGLILSLIVLITVIAGIFLYPAPLPKFLNSGGKEWRPWRLGLDLIGGSHLVYDVDLTKIGVNDRDSVLNGLRDVIEKRVNSFGVSEPQVFIAKSGDKAELVVELAGIKNISEAIQQIGATPLLDFREVQESSTTTPTFIQTNVTGRYITGAQLEFESTTNLPQVAITFNTEGAALFEKLTEANIGKRIAVFLDGQPIEIATVQEKISGGQAVINGIGRGGTPKGQSAIEIARQLVERFNAGALPAPITLVNQQTVSPTLGTNSLMKASVAGVAGTLLVILFMIIYYGVLGVFASIALLIYIVLTLALFKLIPVTLSLAGLAGFILTIGMAVDANILTFERIKEELARGLSKKGALEEGFRRAWPSIRDSNASTMITAFILYFFTSSFVRGFALTLFIGVVLSMFSAITTTRLLLRVFMKDKTHRT